MKTSPSLVPRSLRALASRRRTAAAAGVMLIVVAVAGAALRATGVAPNQLSSDGAATQRAVAVASATPSASRTPAPAATTAEVTLPTATPSQSPRVPLVPVVQFWSPLASISSADLAALVAGSGAPKLFVAAGQLESLAALLGVTPGTSAREATADAVKAAVRADASAVGILPVADVGPDVRALAVDGKSLFGARRVDAGAWPLRVAADRAAPVAGPIWTLVSGGDVMLDRYVYARAVLDGLGPDYPWTGGTASIDGRICCGYGSNQIVVGTSTGDSGALRSIFAGADVAVANLEGPAPDAFTYHSDGLVFTFDPALLAGLAYAGIDVVGLANNHMGNGGPRGVTDTTKNLDAIGIGHTGAGANLAAARAPAWLEPAGVRVAFLSYDAIRPEYWARAGSPGTAGLTLDDVVADVRAARAAGASLVVVLPHWGAEYTDAASAEQRSEAQAIADAGADLILGTHSHWAGGLEILQGSHGPTLVFYSLGDLVFDLIHDERTQESVVADLTFAGSRLVQIDLHPILILDGGQPNLLDRTADVVKVLGDVRRASPNLGW